MSWTWFRTNLHLNPCELSLNIEKMKRKKNMHILPGLLFLFRLQPTNHLYEINNTTLKYLSIYQHYHIFINCNIIIIIVSRSSSGSSGSRSSRSSRSSRPRQQCEISFYSIFMIFEDKLLKLILSPLKYKIIQMIKWTHISHFNCAPSFK